MSHPAIWVKSTRKRAQQCKRRPLGGSKYLVPTNNPKSQGEEEDAVRGRGYVSSFQNRDFYFSVTRHWAVLSTDE